MKHLLAVSAMFVAFDLVVRHGAGMHAFGAGLGAFGRAIGAWVYYGAPT